jgi:hypothetical protein
MSIVTTIRGRPREIWRALHQTPQSKPSPHAFERDLRDLRRLAWEGLYRTDDVETMLLAVRDDRPLDEVAIASGKLVSRYCEMQRELNRIRSPELQRYVLALSEIFDYLAHLLHFAVALLAVSWRSERLREEQQQVGAVGRQGDRLRSVVADLDRMAADPELGLRHDSVDRAGGVVADI